MSILHLDEKNFDEVLSSNSVVMVDFWANWCMPCKMFASVYEKFAAEVGDKVVIGKLEVDEAPSVAAKYGVESIPTIIVFKDGQVANRSVGMISKAELAQMLEV